MSINGLKYIRTRCNYSQHELAELLNVTDAIISKWENEIKVIPDQRKVELSSLLGVPETFFGTLSNKEIEHINSLPMIRVNNGDKEHYKIDMSDNIADGIWRHYYPKTEQSLSEDYIRAKKLKKDTLDEIAAIIGGENTDGLGGIRDAINQIEKGCKRYKFLTRFLQHKESVKTGLKVSYMYELLDVLYAFELAFDIRPETEDEIASLKGAQQLKLYDDEYVRKLSSIMQDHWEQQKSYHMQKMGECLREDE